MRCTRPSLRGYWTKRDSCETVYHLVEKETTQNDHGCSIAMPSKSTVTCIAKRVMAFLEEVGCKYRHLIAKSAQELAIMKLLEELARNRAAAGGG